ncbi:MAG: A/G-specific adenine glycosylase [Verrucomicrobiota bacterium]
MKPDEKRTRLVKSAGEFRRTVVDWFEMKGLDFPWRQTRDPYAVLVSEVMLQQTRIATVLGKGYYTRFLESFPTAECLAVAADAPLLKAWEGLGYYRRARMLRETARSAQTDHGGKFPTEIDALMSLPGIGRYTAGALRAFAFGLPAVLVDGNVSRLLARLTADRTPVDSSTGIRRMWELAGALADDANPRAYHSGLMELGQRVCKPGTPDCGNCPVAAFCEADRPGELPVKSKQVAPTAVAEHALWERDPGGRVLMATQPSGRRAGLWRLPLRDPAEVSGLPQVEREIYAITRYRVTLTVHGGNGGATPRLDERWVSAGDLADLAMAAPFRRVVERLLSGTNK